MKVNDLSTVLENSSWTIQLKDIKYRSLTSYCSCTLFLTDENNQGDWRFVRRFFLVDRANLAEHDLVTYASSISIR